MDLIADCAAQTDCSQQVQRILSRISEVGNVPRNKKKFVNFIKNSMKIYADGPIDETWDYLDKAKNAVAPVLPAVGSAKAAAADAAPDSDRVEKKRKLDQFEEANDSVDDEAAVEKKKKKKKNDKKYHSNDETDEAAAVDSSEEKKAKKKKKERAKEEDRVEYDFKADKPAGEEVEKKKKKKKDKNRG